MVVGGAAAPRVTGCGGGTDEARTSQLTMAVTDAPVDESAAEVVGFTGISLKPARGPALDYRFCLEDETSVGSLSPSKHPVDGGRSPLAVTVG